MKPAEGDTLDLELGENEICCVTVGTEGDKRKPTEMFKLTTRILVKWTASDGKEKEQVLSPVLRTQ